MKILVPVKRVIDYNVKPRVKADGTGVDLANVKMSMNPFDEIAVEEAIRLKEKGVATEIVAVSIGPARRRKRCAPRSPWAPTAPSWSRPTRGRAAGRRQDPQRASAEKPGLVILASRRSTTTPTRPARCWPRCWAGPQGTFASKVEVDGDKRQVTREVDGGLADGEAEAPGDRHHRPAPERAALCLAAEHHEGEEEAAGEEDARRLRRRRRAAPQDAQGRAEPPVRSAGIKVADVDALVAKLKEMGVSDHEVLVWVEHDNASPSRTRRCCRHRRIAAWAKSTCSSPAQRAGRRRGEAAKIAGVAKVHVADDAAYANRWPKTSRR
jgi:electron transfer flavoprotein alpha/beta subunit